MGNIEFRKFGVDDFEDYFRLVGDERVMAQITERAIPLGEAKENYLKLLARNKRFECYGSFKLFLLTGEYIGLGHITPIEENDSVAEIGYMLLPDSWGKGYGTQVAKWLIEQASIGGIERIIAVIDPANVASKRILIKQGFVTEYVGDIGGLHGERLSLGL